MSNKEEDNPIYKFFKDILDNEEQLEIIEFLIKNENSEVFLEWYLKRKGVEEL